MTEAVGNMPPRLVDGTPQASGAPLSGEMLELPPITTQARESMPQTPAASAVGPTSAIGEKRKYGTRFLPSMQEDYGSSPYKTGERSPWDEGD